MLLYLVTLYPGDIVKGRYSAHGKCKAKQHGGLDRFTSKAASMTQFHLLNISSLCQCCTSIQMLQAAIQTSQNWDVVPSLIFHHQSCSI